MRSLSYLFVTALLAAAATCTTWAQFGSGNLVVLRVGDGSASLSSVSTPVFLHEFTPAGAPLQLVPVPATGPTRVTVSGSATSEGSLNRSVDGRFLLFTGYDRDPGVAGVATAFADTLNRVVARVDAMGVVDATTRLNDAFNGSNIRSAVSTDGLSIWASGNGGSGQGGSAGTRFTTLGSTTTTGLHSTTTNIRWVNIFNGQLYVSSQTGTNLGVSTVGTGLPTTPGQTVDLLPGLPTSGTHSNYGFSISPDGQTLYMANDGTVATGGGIQKWVQGTGGIWSLAYILLNDGATTTGTRGLVVDWSGPQPVLYATTSLSNANSLIRVVDMGSTSGATVLATAQPNTAFRGVAFSPTAGGPAPAIPGVWYASTGFTDGGRLLTINSNTGIGTLVGPTGIAAVPGLAIRPSDGLVVATEASNPSALYIIDAATGVATTAAPTTLRYPDALSFGADGMLYAVGLDASLSQDQLYTVDLGTGATTLIGNTGAPIRGMAFDPTTGVMWGSAGAVGPTADNIYTINLSTGTATLVGATGLGGATPDILFDQSGNLYGVKGGGLSPNRMFSINKATGAGTFLPDTVGFRAVSGLASFVTPVFPVFAMSPGSLNFGSVLVGTVGTDSVQVSNPGHTPLVISFVTSSGPPFEVQPSSAVVNVGASQWFHVTFAPTAPGAANGVVTFTHNAAGSPTLLPLSGTGATQEVDMAAVSIDYPAAGIGIVPELSLFLPKASFRNNRPQDVSSPVRFEIFSAPPVPVYSSELTIFFPGGALVQVGFVPVLAGLPQGTYTARAIALLEGDNNRSNDTVTGVFHVVGAPVPLSEDAPLTEDFEDPPSASMSGGSGWIAVPVEGPNDWIRGTPAKTQIARAHSGIKAFVTKLVDNYTDDQESYLHAPILDLSTLVGDLGVSFFSNFKTEQADGCVLELSTDLGATWSRVDPVLGTGSNYNTPTSVGWYNEGVGSGSNITPPYWGGGEGGGTSSANYAQPDSGWVLCATRISGVAGLSDVRLRWHFSANGSGNSEGHAIDNITFSASPVLFALPRPMHMGSVTVNTSKVDSIVVSSVGTYLLNITAESLVGDAEFSLTSVGPVSLGPGTSVSYVISYSPTAVGPQSARLILTHNGPSSPDTILITGAGAPAQTYITLDPDTLFNADPLKPFKSKKAVKRGKNLYPNWTNLVEETVAQGGFQPAAGESDDAGGMVIGVSHMFNGGGPGPAQKWRPVKDSAKVRGWIRLSKFNFKKNQGASASAIQKTLRNKTFWHLDSSLIGNVPRGLDSTGVVGTLFQKRKPILGQKTKLDPKKTPHKLFSELVALKFNIAASALNKTPPGFGELIYDVDGNTFDEMSLVEISNLADTAMTYWKGVSSTFYDDLYAALRAINRAFVTPLDTTGGSFEGDGVLRLTAGRNLSEAPFLKEGLAPPRILTPTSTATETEEEWDDEEWDEDEENGVPTAAKLYQNYPNPFNPTTTIAFRVRDYAYVTLRVYNVLGQEVAVLLDGEELEEGYHTVQFGTGTLSSGVYFYRITAQDSEGEHARVVESKKMLLIK